MPSAFEWRGARYDVVDVIGRWRIEGRWWDDGRDREYWRVEARGGAVWDLYHDYTAGLRSRALIAPVSAIILGTLFLGELILPSHLLGMLVIFLGLSFIDGRLPRLLRQALR